MQKPAQWLCLAVIRTSSSLVVFKFGGNGGHCLAVATQRPPNHPSHPPAPSLQPRPWWRAASCSVAEIVILGVLQKLRYLALYYVNQSQISHWCSRENEVSNSFFRFSLRLASLKKNRVKKLQIFKRRDRKQFFSPISVYKLRNVFAHSDSAQHGESEGIFCFFFRPFPDWLFWAAS